MSLGADHSGPDEPERPLAAEYVLGVLDAAERRLAEDRLAREPAFAAEVAFWESRLGPLADDVAPVTPPAALWTRIEASLPRTGSVAPVRPSLWNSLAFWRTLSVGSLGLAAAALAALLFPPTTAQMPMPMVARLGPASGGTSFVAAIDPARRAVMIIPAALAASDPRVPELWVVPADGIPRSLGVFDPARPAAINVPDALLPQLTREAALAVSLEPPGGSPTGRPTGPVVAQGTLTTF